MADQPENKLTNHEYDGIQEYDNRLPAWWLWCFYLTIAFAAGYWIYYTYGGGPDLSQELQAEQERHATLHPQSPQGGQGPDESQLLALVQNPAVVAKGKAAFLKTCLPCHGAQGQGGIGPNLTDDYWIHGNKMTDMLKVVKSGVPEKGMPPWGPVLSEEDQQASVAFIRTLHGTHPAGAKAPQGSKY